MAGGKRASMREGPLAALFRRTDEDAPRGASERRAAAPPEPQEAEPASSSYAAGPLREQTSRERRRVPSPKERLSAAFAQDIPHDVLERPGEPQREYRPARRAADLPRRRAPAGAARRRRRRRAA